MDPILIRLIDALADIWVGIKHAGQALDDWNAQPAYGRISVNGVLSMTAPTAPTPIPSENCPAVVQWFDRLDTSIPHDKTTTTWSAEDEAGAATTAVTVNPDLDSDNDDETATIVFNAGTGIFRVVASTPGAGGVTVRAESGLYDIQPGAPAVGVITVTPAS